MGTKKTKPSYNTLLHYQESCADMICFMENEVNMDLDRLDKTIDDPEEFEAAYRQLKTDQADLAGYHKDMKRLCRQIWWHEFRTDLRWKLVVFRRKLGRILH